MSLHPGLVVTIRFVGTWQRMLLVLTVACTRMDYRRAQMRHTR
ncbi:hypothetical protein NBRC111894_486 [Sporolactobacillus inulinus]|uniref:Uncharacterized protein n=1 Tax=Sporolactobacillus inulinus TaxID=2078 RepID=A0A4Y1Z7B4_9BACL|nr:hypothetical protein NBRC111894_486 [Sporolactobacillus inulinus]